jgi:ureidoglycolate dehydrogenase (NAD+)
MQAERFGIPGHGLIRLPHYVDRIQGGSINPTPHITIVKEGPSTSLDDGDNGHVVSNFAMKKAIDLAKNGAGFVAARQSSHFGIAGYYSLMAARQGMIGLSLTLVDACMAPFGGSSPFLGSNPIALAAPTTGPHPILLDISTSAVAWGKIMVARSKNEPISEEWAIDADGRPTTDPQKARALRPMADHKGYGLAFFFELLCSGLTGAPFGPHLIMMYGDPTKPRKLGHFFGAIRPGAFVLQDEFERNTEQLTNEIHQVRAAPGFQEVLVPGDLEFKQQAKSDSEGIHVGPSIAEELRALAKRLNLKFPSE